MRMFLKDQTASWAQIKKAEAVSSIVLTQDRGRDKKKKLNEKKKMKKIKLNDNNLANNLSINRTIVFSCTPFQKAVS